jgi:hypothetical protein
MRFIISALVVFLSHQSISQIRFEKLEIPDKQSYKITGSDILVVDTLILRDSSRIYLNSLIKENIINAKVLIVGKGCTIDGRGTKGAKGKPGQPGAQQNAPCSDGANGSDGINGTPGKDGMNLSLYVGSLKMNGTLTIDLNGGDGGEGGKGGKGGDGGNGTRVCRGGNGGKGGNGGNGTNGGNGGKMIINCKSCADLHLFLGQQLILKTYGGFAGTGGDYAAGGYGGLGPKVDGKIGSRGQPGQNGTAGKTGIIALEKN